MANGKGTIMCCYCKHVTWGYVFRCNFHEVDLPVKKYGSMNLLCADFEEGPSSEPHFSIAAQFSELAPHMKKGELYAFPYPSQNRPHDLEEAMSFTK